MVTIDIPIWFIYVLAGFFIVKSIFEPLTWWQLRKRRWCEKCEAEFEVKP